MKNIIKKFAMQTVAALTLLSVGGCSIYGAIESDKEAVAEAKTLVTTSKAEARYARVSVVPEFYVPPLTKNDVSMPDWYFSPVNSAYSSAPFAIAVSDLLRGKPATAKFVDLTAEDKASPMTISFSGKLGDALVSLAKTAGYAIEFAGDAVVFSKFEEETFHIAGLPGDYRSSIGNDGEMSVASQQGNGTSQSSTASIDAGNKQFSQLSLADASLIKDLESALTALKTSEGKVAVSPITMTVFVKDVPSAVQAMRRVVEKVNDELTKTVSLDILLVDVIYTNENRAAFDASMMAKLLDGKAVLKSATSGSPFIAGPGATPTPAQYNLELLTGDFSGSQIFLDALSKQGFISRSFPVKVSLANGTQAKVMSVDTEMYVAEQYGNNATTGGVLTGGGARQDTLQTGQIYNVFARAIKDDIVFKINASLSAKRDIQVKDNKESGLYLESPKTTAMIFDATYTLEDGKTRVVTGLNAETINVSDANAGYDVLGFARSSERVHKETVMLVTANIVRGAR